VRANKRKSRPKNADTERGISAPIPCTSYQYPDGEKNRAGLISNAKERNRTSAKNQWLRRVLMATQAEAYATERLRLRGGLFLAG
jgi:hypothetical protein